MAEKYPLVALLNLREFRQEKAMHLVQTCERKLLSAKNGVITAVKKHEDFLVWLDLEEARRYESIMETQMTLLDVDDFKTGLLGIRSMEAGFLEQILKAKHHQEACEKEVVKAKDELLKAQKGTMKIEVHREKWLDRMKLEEERAEELEMEDFISPAVNFFPQEEDQDNQAWG